MKSDDNTRVSFVIEGPFDAKGRFLPGRPPDEYIEITSALDGDLAGFTTRVRFVLYDGRVCVASSTTTPTEPVPVSSLPARARRNFCTGDFQSLIEEAFSTVKVPQIERWLTALRAERPRPGRSKTSEAYYALALKRRIEAQRRWPGKAIRNMVREWPQMFTTESAATSLINKASRPKLGLLVPGELALTPKALDLLGEEED